MEKPDEKISYF